MLKHFVMVVHASSGESSEDTIWSLSLPFHKRTSSVFRLKTMKNEIETILEFVTWGLKFLEVFCCGAHLVSMQRIMDVVAFVMSSGVLSMSIAWLDKVPCAFRSGVSCGFVSFVGFWLRVVGDAGGVMSNDTPWSRLSVLSACFMGCDAFSGVAFGSPFWVLCRHVKEA